MGTDFIGRAIIYVRVSTDDQADNNSLPTQIAACEQYAAQHGFSIVATLQDVMSGAKLERPGLSKVRELIRMHTVDVLIVYASDRLTRNLAHSLLLRDELRGAGVVLHCVTKGQSQDTPEGNLFDSIESAFAEYERMKIRERVNRGKRGKAESGKVIGSGDAPYGYEYTGQGRDKDIAIVEREARTIQDIFTWFVEGVSVVGIQRRLTNMRIPTPTDAGRRVINGKKRGYALWGRATIYDILNNETYAGTCYAFRSDRTGKKFPKDQWIPITVPAIIDRATWDATQAKLAVGRQMSQRNNKKHFYLLRCRVKCQCTFACVGVALRDRKLTRRYYQCGDSMNPAGHGCTMRKFRANDVEHTVWEWIDTHVLNEDHIRAAVADREDTSQEQRTRLNEERDRYYRQLAELDTQVERLAQLFTAGLYKIEEVAKQKAGLDAAKASTREEIGTIEQRLKGLTVAKDDAEKLCVLVRLIRAKLEAGITDETKRVVIDLLDTEVKLVRIDGEKFVDVVCYLTLDTARLRVVASGEALQIVSTAL